MNPPYDKNLHLKILDKITKDFPGTKVVSLNPVGWLQDPLAKNKKSDYNRFLDLRRKIEDIAVIDKLSAEHIFNARMHQNLALYKIGNGGFDCSVFIKKYESFINKVKNCKYHWEDKIDSNKVDGIRVRTQRLCGGEHSSFERLYDKYSLMQNSQRIFVDGKWNNKWWTDFAETRNQYSKSIGDPLVDSIKFNTLEEAKNFEAFAKTKFMTFCNRVSKVGVNTNFSFLPFMPTYTHPWTDEDLYKYFNLTQDEINMTETEMSDKGTE